MFITFLIHLRN